MTDPNQATSTSLDQPLTKSANFDGIKFNVLTLTKLVGATVENGDEPSDEVVAPNEMQWGLNNGRQAFIPLAPDHGEISTLARSLKSKIKVKLGILIMLGSTESLDWKIGKLIPCDKFTFPFAISQAVAIVAAVEEVAQSALCHISASSFALT